ncbi:DUF2076 family protein [Rhodoferax sp.]|uniref:DUF2076 family protein n=1 Tax=Rhodoferax sp. TaxID=50421 RepID=UPI00374D2EEA
MQIFEREQLSRFLQQLALAQAGPKDAEAQALINTAMSHQPDAAYLLVQRSLLQDGALQAAQAQIASLQAELQQARSATAPASGNFLDSADWGRAPVAPAFAPAPTAMAAPAYPQAPVQLAATPSRFQAPSFLTSVATTAAGVAAGAFLFQGIESLIGHHGSGGMGSATAFGLSEPMAAFPPLDTSMLQQANDNAFADTAILPSDNDLDVFGNNDVLDIGGSNDWA